MGIGRALYFVGRVSVGAGWAFVKGVANTAGDTCRVVHRLAKKDFEGSLEVVEQRIERTIYGVASAVESSLELVEDACEAKEKGQSFLREENIQRMTNVASLGMAAAVGWSLIDGDDSSIESTESVTDSLGEVASATQFDAGSDLALAQSHGLDPSAIHNGVFVGDQQDLTALIRAGEDPNSVHVEQENIERSDAVKSEFLAMHGLTDTPEGYELHHIQPLSEGGTDTPNNMILVREDVHDQITAAHRSYYQWNS